MSIISNYILMLKIQPKSMKVINDPRLCFVKGEINNNDKTVRMLVLLPNGGQNLLTFHVPDENCTVEDLLQQANIPSGSNIKVSLIKDSSSLNINYVIEFKGKSGMNASLDNHVDDNNDDDDSDNDVSLCDDRNSVHLPADEIAMNESDSSDIFSLPKDTKGGSIKCHKIIDNSHRILQSEESEGSTDFEEEKKEDRSTARLSLAEKSGSCDENEVRNMTEDSAVLTHTFLTCRAGILGSYYFVPKGRVIVSQNGIKMSVPDPEDGTNFHSVELKFEEALKVLVCFANEIPVLFVWTLSKTGHRIRKQLGMHDSKGLYFDPVGSDDKQRRLTLLPEMISEESKQILNKLFRPRKVIEELNIKSAYNTLKKAMPENIWPKLRQTLKESINANKSTARSSRSDGIRTEAEKRVKKLPERTIELAEESTSKCTNVVENKTRKILIYPPRPAIGGISINTNDYACLNEGEFLNDTIIDFYLKYLTLEILSIEDRNRTYVFSSHFYTRLTSVCHSVDESDESLSPAAQRHAKVSKWTKDVNIFEKDFILVPIVEHEHWFLAIICFPNLVESVKEMAIKFSREQSAEQRNKRWHVVATMSEKEEKKFPCLLIFDSLAGTANQNRVAARLRDYLTYEHLAKIGTRKIFSNRTIKAASPKVPQQSNCSDCGIYVLQYAESFFNDPIEDYTLPIKSLEYWFEEIVVIRKRKELAKLIKELSIK